MQTLIGHACEVIASVWLVLVAVQYLSRYLVPGLGADFARAYCVMLVLLALAGGFRLFGKRSDVSEKTA